MSQVRQLWRYPVKSMQGEPVTEVAVGPTGIAGDRRYAVVSQDGHVLSAKRVPELLMASARAIGRGLAGPALGQVAISLPDGTEVLAEDPSTEVVLSNWLDRPVRLVDAPHNAGMAYQMTFDPPDDTAEHFDIPTPAGQFVDLAHVHVLTAEALERCRAARPDIDWDVRRFRPNVLADANPGAGAGATPVPEAAWVGHRVAIGPVELHVDQETVRCAMPLRAQPGLERCTDVYRVLDALNANHLGVYATVTTPGTVAVGDPIVVR